MPQGTAPACILLEGMGALPGGKGPLPFPLRPQPQKQSAQYIHLIRTVLGDTKMARRRRRSGKGLIRKRNEMPLTISRRPRLLPLQRQILQLEDRRQWHPSRTLRPRPLPVTVGSMRRTDRLISAGPTLKSLNFEKPSNVAVCVRRKQRKEIMHALRATGKGASSRKKKRRNYWSSIGCRS